MTNDNHTTKDTEKQVAIFMLTVLRVVINEQVKAGLLKKEVGDYIYDACRDMAVKQGFIEESSSED